MSIVVIKFTKPTAALKKFIYNLTNFYFINDFKNKTNWRQNLIQTINLKWVLNNKKLQKDISKKKLTKKLHKLYNIL